MKRILVPTDFSKEANKALEMAHLIAVKAQQERGDVEIDLLHTEEGVGQDSYQMTGAPLKNHMDDVFMMKILAKVQKKAKHLASLPEMADVKIKPFVRLGELKEVVADHLERRPADLIVMGNREMSDWDRFWEGSNSERLAYIKETPIIVAHEEVHPKLDTIVLATDKNHNIHSALTPLRELQQVTGAEIKLVRITTPGVDNHEDKVLEELVAFAQDNGLSNCSYHTFKDNSVEHGVINFAQAQGADVIAMVSHHHNMFVNVYLHDQSFEVKEHSSLPFLLLPAA